MDRRMGCWVDERCEDKCVDGWVVGGVWSVGGWLTRISREKTGEK